MEGTVLISVNDKDKDEVVALAKDFNEAGFKILASKGTKALLDEAGIPCEVALKLQEGRPNILDLITNGKIDMIVNTPDGGASDQEKDPVHDNHGSCKGYHQWYQDPERTWRQSGEIPSGAACTDSAKIDRADW